MNDLTCPTPFVDQHQILLAHGGGGRLMHQLLAQTIFPALGSSWLEQPHDGVVLQASGQMAFTTDAYVVRPLEFPGGDIGSLAVYGTVNDLAMCGARPRWLSLNLILEEGLETALLRRILASVAASARRCGVEIVTGDTKVVGRGQADGMYLATTGIGEVMAGQLIGPRQVQLGDALIVSGDLGRHGVAIMASREGLGFETELASDCAPVHEMVLALLEAGIDLHCLRDPTRGGLASALHEIAAVSGLSFWLEEAALPVHEAVAGACEILGLDPLYVACEGRFLACLPAAQVDRALTVLKAHPQGHGAKWLGWVGKPEMAPVLLRGTLGTVRVVDLPSGEQLPRIC
ncbi:MAG: hydrogenase expression/formation protein HypE [Candidatus Sericytochromatia bacterium]